MAVKKKNAVKELSPKDRERITSEQLAVFTAATEGRHAIAKAHYEKQTDDTQDAIERIADLLSRVGYRRMWVKTEGHKVVIDLPDEVVKMNAFYMACEILKDLAMFDIRVADYTFPTDSCASCGTPLVRKAKKKGKR